MTRARPRPRRTRLAPCVYRADYTMPDPTDQDHPLCACGLPHRHPRHAEPAGVREAQEEHRRRLGEHDEER